MEGSELFLIIFGSILAIVGIALFTTFIWFKKTVLGYSSIKLYGVEISLSHPALFIFVVGCILLTIPFFSPSEQTTYPIQIDETTESDYLWWSTKAFFLGHDLLDLMGVGMATVMSDTPSTREEGADLYRGMRHAFLQAVKMFDIDIEIDIPSDPAAEWVDEIEVIDFFFSIDDELQWKIQAIDSIYYQWYRLGRWTGLVVVNVAYHQQHEQEEIQEALGNLIERFDEEFRGFQGFDIGNDIKMEFENLYRDLVLLSRVGAIDGDDFYFISDRVDRITEMISEEAY